MKIFDFNDYRLFLTESIKEMPSNGRGQNLKISKAICVQPSHLSQVLKGARDFSLEQAYMLSEYLKLNSLETSYFLNMVHLSKAGHYKLKEYYESELEKISKEANKLENRLKVKKKLSEKDTAHFYSHSNFSHARLLTSINKIKNIKDISKNMNLSETQLQEILSFLIETGLVVENKSGLKLGPSKTHLCADSPYIFNHHRNWRMKAIEKQAKRDPKDLYYSGPMVLAEKDFPQVKELLSKCLEDIYKIIIPSKSEKLYCLNFDCFEVI